MRIRSGTAIRIGTESGRRAAVLIGSVLALLCTPQSVAARQADPDARPRDPAPVAHRWADAGIEETCGEGHTRIVLEQILGEKGYYFSLLADPPRLVVDVLAPLRSVPVKEIDLKGDVVYRIRFGNHPHKLRAVLDLRRALRSEPLVQKQGKDLVVELGGKEPVPQKTVPVQENPTGEKKPAADADPDPVRIEAIRFSQTRQTSDVTLHLDGIAPFDVRERGNDLLIELEGAQIELSNQEAFHPLDRDSEIVSVEPEQADSGGRKIARIRIRLRAKRPFDVIDKGTVLCIRVKVCEPLPECYLGDAVRESCKVEPLPWMEPLAMAWRRQYAAVYLPGYLFREDAAFGAIPPDSEGEAHPLLSRELEAQSACRDLCSLGEKYLAWGFLPEATAQYRRALELGCPQDSDTCLPQVGLLKTYLAMSRFVDAEHTLKAVSAGEDVPQSPLLLLAEAVLQSFDGDLQRAAGLFTETVPHWHLCRNVQAFAGHILYQQGRYREARNVFRVVRCSPWKDLQDFGTLGLADSYWAMDQCKEAEGLYEALAGRGSPLGWLGLAEFRLREGDVERAGAALGMLRSSTAQDYWKGVALVYGMSVHVEKEQWAAALEAAERDQGLVLGEPWAPYLEKQIVRALAGEIRGLSEAGSQEEIPLLAHRWSAYLKKLPFSAQLLLARTYEGLGMVRSAMDVYGRFKRDPACLFQGARLACRAGEYEKAQSLLKGYFDSGDPLHREEARMLGVVVLFHLNRPDAAKEYLRRVGFSGDPFLLAEVAGIEESLGMLDGAIRRYRAALEACGDSEPERAALLRKMADLYYRRGDYPNSLAFAREAPGTDGRGERTASVPIEVFSLLRLENPEKAKPVAQGLSGGLTAKVVGEIVAAHELATTLRRQGYAD